MAIKDLTNVKKHLFLCAGGSCKLMGSEDSIAAVRSAIAERGLSDEIHTTKTLCNGRCKDGPIIIAQPAGIWFKKMVKERAEFFVREFLIRDCVPKEYVLYEYGWEFINAEG